MTGAVARFTGMGEEWDRFVRGQPGWTHFHLWGWKAVIEEVFGHECVYLACRAPDGALTGVLPLVRVRSLVFGHYLVSMPFLNYGGPLGSDAAVTALAADARAMAERDRVKLLELRSRSELPVDLTPSHRKITTLVDIPGGEAEQLWAALASKTRTKVRRPQKEGVTVRFGPAELEPFFRIFAHHMRDLGTPTQSARFFRAIRDAFPDSVVFGCAYLPDGTAIAGGCGFVWDREFEISWSSALRAHASLRANYFLHWSFMEHAAGLGCQVYNFGRSTPGGGTHEFKKQWGGRDVPLWWYQYPGGDEAQTPSPDQGAWAWGPRLWQRLPVAAATWLGPRIVRGIP